VAAAAAVVVAIAVILACGVAYKGARDALLGSADSTLTSAHAQLYSPQGVVDLEGAPGVAVQLVDPNGASITQDGPQLPVDQTVKDVASGKAPAQFRTVTDGGATVREYITQLPAGTVVQEIGVLTTPAALVLSEDIQGIQNELEALGFKLALLALFGVLIAALFGWLAARAALVPLEEMTRDIEEIAASLDVSVRVTEGTDDELGRLRRAFNELLEEVELSQDSQRQLILDASHELRTPLTSLRANAQVLGRLDELESGDVTQLSDDMVTQVDELTRLVGDLTELTRGEHSVEEATSIELDELVGDLSEVFAVHARTKQITFELALEPCRVVAKRDRLVRAIGNLLDNAIKFSPPGGSVLVSCADGTVTVEDSGPGVAEGDKTHIFDRFYRSPKARGLPGSGLGLAIVAQVVAEAGGTIRVDRSDALGGAKMVLRLAKAPTS
jgi:two-component system sensor histidine kinase MprB